MAFDQIHDMAPCATLRSMLQRPAVLTFDARVDSAFDHLRSRSLANRSFYFLSEAANHSILWHALAWGRVLLRRSDAREAITISAALGIESALVNGPIKAAFRRDRPVHEGERPHQLRTPKTSSFPSGHATSAMCATLLLSRGRRTGPLYLALGLLVALSRVHVKIHHASDVVGGLTIGTALGLIARRTTRRIGSH